MSTDRLDIAAGTADKRLAHLTGGLARRLPLLLLPFAGVLVWQVVIWVAQPQDFLLPPPLDVLDALVDERSRLWHHALGTIEGSLAGFLLALVAGLLLAIAISASRAVDRAVYPWAIASQAVPILALAPLLAIWLGDEAGRLAVAGIVAFFPVVVTGVDGLRGGDPEIAAVLRTMGASRLQVWRLATFPAALPPLFTGLRLAAVFSVTGAVVAEYVGADRGLGYLSELERAQFRTDVVLAAIVLLAVIGVAFFALVALAERLCLPYRRHATPPRWRHR